MSCLLAALVRCVLGIQGHNGVGHLRIWRIENGSTSTNEYTIHHQQDIWVVSTSVSLENDCSVTGH